ncbi:MAG: type IV pilus modification protein PilV [Magnetococcus sp. WYHC-3]
MIPNLRMGGFTLLEVLITLGILSLALLGLARMQMEGLRHVHGGQLRGSATFLAQDILERMRANREQAVSGADAAFPYRLVPGQNITAPPCMASDCTPAQMAAFDLSQWQGIVASALPAGTGAVSRSGPSGRKVFTVVIQWDPSRGVDPVQTLTVTTEL